jgi:hypothetical protein
MKSWVAKKGCKGFHANAFGDEVKAKTKTKPLTPI